MDGSRRGGSVAAGARPLFHRSRLKLAIAPSAVSIARRWTAEQLARAGPAPGFSPLDPDLVHSAVLVVSELVTNAIRAVSEVTPVGMLLPGRLLSFGGGAAFDGLGPAGPPAPPGPPGPAVRQGRRAARAVGRADVRAWPDVVGGVRASSRAGRRGSGQRVAGHLPVQRPHAGRRARQFPRAAATRLPADACDETGRGLTVVAALAENWGWCPEPFGKAVWCELAVTAGHADSEDGG